MALVIVELTPFFTANTSIYRVRMKTPGTPIARASRASG
jgi:hypothetical protein